MSCHEMNQNRSQSTSRQCKRMCLEKAASLSWQTPQHWPSATKGLWTLHPTLPRLEKLQSAMQLWPQIASTTKCRWSRPLQPHPKGCMQIPPLRPTTALILGCLCLAEGEMDEEECRSLWALIEASYAWKDFSRPERRWADQADHPYHSDFQRAVVKLKASAAQATMQFHLVHPMPPRCLALAESGQNQQTSQAAKYSIQKSAAWWSSWGKTKKATCLCCIPDWAARLGQTRLYLKLWKQIINHLVTSHVTFLILSSCLHLDLNWLDPSEHVWSQVQILLYYY